MPAARSRARRRRHPPATAMNWSLAVLRPGEEFPAPERALGSDSPYPGLLAAGGSLDAPTLQRAYSQGIFPWFGEDEPLLWWSPDPRMVLLPGQLRVHRSLRQAARRMAGDPRYALRVDTAFEAVMRGCAAPRRHGGGTWIVEPIVAAYCALHRLGLAHSFELWRDDRLVAGLYLVGLGGCAFGESMFTRVSDGSKVLLMALCGFALAHGLRWIDCQQQTAHLAGLGARPWPRRRFLDCLAQARALPAPPGWQYDWTQFRQHCAAWL